MRPRTLLLLALTLSFGCGNARSGGGTIIDTDASTEDTPSTDDTPVPTFDLPATPDVPVTPDVLAPRDVIMSVDACVPNSEATSALCHDGRDNDCDNLTDCDDVNCVPFCGASVDGGRDGCVARGPENTNAACSNGVDDDCDGYID